MMNVGVADAKSLTLYEYQALLHNWEAAHSSEDDAPEAPTIEEAQRRMARMEAKGYKVLH